MADIITFDGLNKIITEISVGGDNELDLVEIYSEAKEWMAGFIPFNTETDVNGTSEEITILTHGQLTGDGVQYLDDGGIENIGLTNGVTYYVNVVDVNTIQLYDTRVNAIAGGATGRMDLTASGVGNGERHRILANNMKFQQVFGVVGGDPITPTQNLGATFFLENGWRIRPAELNHKLTIVGNLFTREPGQSPFVATIGAYTVNTETRVSSLVDSSVARLDLAQLLPYVYIDTINGVAGTDEGIGVPTNPVNNIVDARVIADRDKLRGYQLRGTITLDQNYDNWEFVGLGSEQAATVNLGGQSVNNSSFASLTLEGAMQTPNSIEANFCGLNVLSELSGIFRNCGFINNFAIQTGGTATFADCFSQVPGLGTPICDINGGDNVGFRNYSGGIELLNVQAGDQVSVDLDPGTLILGVTNTGGEVNVRGTGSLTDNSNGTTVYNNLVSGPLFQLLVKLMRNRMETDQNTGTVRVYDDDDTTVLLEGNIWEDVAASIVYRERGIQRRDRMT